MLKQHLYDLRYSRVFKYRLCDLQFIPSGLESFVKYEAA